MAKKVLRTKLCDMLEIEYPIILAGMFSVSGPTLAAAVSNAGGLGVLGVTGLTVEQVQSWIKKTRSLTDKPFGVDILMPVMPESGNIETLKTELPAEHVSFINKLKKELGVPDVKTPDRSVLTMEEVIKVVDLILEERPPVFCSGLGSPEWVIPKMHSQGIKVISLVGNVKTARRVAERGADIVMAQGHEAGGHTGRIGTMALIPQVVDAVRPRPVVAAGGIGDGRGLVAALALGAIGIWVGSAFIPTHESFVDYIEMEYTIDNVIAESWKQNMLNADEESTVRGRTYTGKTARTLKNKLTELWEKSGMSYLPMPLQGTLLMDLNQGFREAHMTDYLPNFAGQITGMLKEIKPARQLVEEMVEEASEILESRLPVEVATR